jgi:hypothetical protein
VVVQVCALPVQALLRGYSGGGGYTDCFVVETGARVSLARYVEAFYTSWLFRLERLVLTFATRPSSDRQAVALAAGNGSAFAAWEVESRTVDQLLMRDITGRTRSWFMVVPAAGGTRLYFGSAVTTVRPSTGGLPTIGPVFQALVAFHVLYSRALLAAACGRLQRHAEQVNL